MTPDIIKQLREAEAKATRGEWTHNTAGTLLYHAEENNRMATKLSVEQNASLITLMRNNLIPLLDRIEELERENEAFKNAFTNLYNAMHNSWWESEGCREMEGKDFVTPAQLERLEAIVKRYINPENE